MHTVQRYCDFVVINQQPAVGTGFKSAYPSHAHRKTSGNTQRIPIPTELENRASLLFSFNAYFSAFHILSVCVVAYG